MCQFYVLLFPQAKKNEQLNYTKYSETFFLWNFDLRGLTNDVIHPERTRG